jgi:formylglycine-generating enzyme required for sulfatase activity
VQSQEASKGTVEDKKNRQVLALQSEIEQKYNEIMDLKKKYEQEKSQAQMYKDLADKREEYGKKYDEIRCLAEKYQNEIKVWQEKCEEQEELLEKYKKQGDSVEIKTSKSSIPSTMVYVKTNTYQAGGKTHTVKEYRHEKTGMEFILIPAGTFLCESENKKPYTVKVEQFLISKTEITQEAWQKIMKSNPSRFSGKNLPVESVSWHECVEFCEKIGLELPTENQWEYACRSGTQSEYYWGNTIEEEYCWYQENAKQTNPVMKKKPNAFGVYDMIGNVGEWCKNMSPELNPVIRGGSWTSSDVECASNHRYPCSPNFSHSNLGLRCVLNLP